METPGAGAHTTHLAMDGHHHGGGKPTETSVTEFSANA